MQLDVKATDKFFKRRIPDFSSMELIAQKVTNTAAVRLFIREIDDSDNPRRTCVELTNEQCDRFADALAAYAKEQRQRMRN